MSKQAILHLFSQFKYSSASICEHILPHLLFLPKQEKRRILLKKNDIPSQIYFPLESYGRVFYIDEEGKDITVRFVKCGEIMGFDQFFLDQQPVPYQLEMLKGGTAYSLPFQVVYQLSQTDISFNRALRRIQAEQLLWANQFIEWLKTPYKDRITPLLEQYPKLRHLVSLEEMASYTGMSLASFKRHYNK